MQHELVDALMALHRRELRTHPNPLVRRPDLTPAERARITAAYTIGGLPTWTRVALSTLRKDSK